MHWCYDQHKARIFSKLHLSLHNITTQYIRKYNHVAHMHVCSKSIKFIVIRNIAVYVQNVAIQVNQVSPQDNAANASNLHL